MRLTGRAEIATFYAMSIDQLTAEAMALPLGDRVRLLLEIQDSLPDERKSAFDPEYLHEVARRADELKPGSAVGEGA